LISLSVTTIATGLLVIPGVWLYTRWSLTTPVIREEDIGPIAATRRSSQLVSGRFWFVFMTTTVAYYLEGVLIHFGAQVAGLVTGSHTWGEWVGGSIVATLAMPLAAFATSLAHSSVARREGIVEEDSRAKVGQQERISGPQYHQRAVPQIRCGAGPKRRVQFRRSVCL
jgi:hypothetical protein